MQSTPTKWTATILALCLLSATTAWAAADYSAMTNDELAAKRGTIRNATAEERNAFHNEWQKRVQQMSPEERQQAVNRPANAPQDGSGRKQGQGKGSGQRLQDGSGGGMGGGRGMGRGGGF